MYKKLMNWYLSRQAIPFWYVLLTDSCIVFTSGIAAYALNHGLSVCTQNFGTLLYTLAAYQLCYWVGFRIFHTYSGIIRKSSFVDLIRSSLSLLIGVVLVMLLRVFVGADAWLLVIRFRDLLLQVTFGTFGMCGLRITAKVFYDLYLKHRGLGSVYGRSGNALLDLEMKYLLLREPIDIDMKLVREELRGKRILVTGAAGSIGSELTRQLAACEPEQLILIDQAETPLHEIRLYMAREWSEIPCQTIVTDMCHSHRMEHLFQTYRPEFVFHVAAYKHVPMLEDNPVESILNNVDGTRKLALLSVKYRVGKFVMVSTDKAVNPTSVMGCSKRICEIYCQSLAKVEQKRGGCKFITTRFGNVLGSNGSVIPIFREQIRRGGPVTVTHPDVIRYFMLIPEACQLVLEAGTKGQGGEIFVFDMGKPVRIADLAKRMIELSGEKNIQIEYVGLRPGEKLYEDVLCEDEKLLSASHGKIRIAQVREYDFEEADKQINELIETARSYDAAQTLRLMKQIVPEYSSEIKQ